MTGTYSHVDAAADVQGAVDWQDRVDSWPEVQAYKAYSHTIANDLRPVLDVGCGPGHDLLELGAGSLGVDRSRAMATRAAARGATVALAEAARLPFSDGAFGATRADRVLQHLEDPDGAVREMMRVTRSGGRVVVADPDQESLVIHVPGVRTALVERIKALRRDVGYRNGRLVRTLPATFAASGLVDVTVRGFPLLLTDPHDAFGLPTWVDYWRARGQSFTAADAAEWAAGMERSRAGGFVYALLYFVVGATVP